MVEHRLVGKSATVTGKVGPGTTGEIAVHVRGGTESYFARPADGTEVIDKGTQVVIVSAAAGRTVYVTALGAI
jgi:membrane protein implicated in regulation of membrane protease activity